VIHWPVRVLSCLFLPRSWGMRVVARERDGWTADRLLRASPCRRARHVSVFPGDALAMCTGRVRVMVALTIWSPSGLLYLALSSPRCLALIPVTASNRIPLETALRRPVGPGPSTLIARALFRVYQHGAGRHPKDISAPPGKLDGGHYPFFLFQ